ncbi:unnamed protein product [Discula destructiva]
MRFTHYMTLGLLRVVILAAASPPRSTHAVEVLSYLPDKVVWHATNAITADSTLESSPGAFPIIGGNVTACSSVVYDQVSPARTSVVRDDCADLAEQVKTASGFWELFKWSHDASDEFDPLVSNGTCEFAVKRRKTPAGSNSGSSSDVVIIGNYDVYKILNASVHDYAAAADEPYVDAERNQGHMNCKWWSSANASMEFRIENTGSH